MVLKSFPERKEEAASPKRDEAPPRGPTNFLKTYAERALRQMFPKDHTALNGEKPFSASLVGVLRVQEGKTARPKYS